MAWDGMAWHGVERRGRERRGGEGGWDDERRWVGGCARFLSGVGEFMADGMRCVDRMDGWLSGEDHIVGRR